MDLPSPSMNVFHEKLCIIMVGAPARGKSFIALKLQKYLSMLKTKVFRIKLTLSVDWSGYKSRVFNVGQKRRETVGNTPAIFFSDTNKEDTETREKVMITSRNSDKLACTICFG